MKTYLECIPCFFKQALDVSALCGISERKKKLILDELAALVPDWDLSISPPEVAGKVHSVIRAIIKNEDPYARVKDESIQAVTKIIPRLKRRIRGARDPLRMAVELAIAGNIIDYGLSHELDVAREIAQILRYEKKALAHEAHELFNYSGFKRLIARARSILIVGDNAGETIFDALLIEEIKRSSKREKDITYAVRSAPVLNDATPREALLSGLGEVSRIITTGARTPGAVLRLCSKEFKQTFGAADCVISKGQGNYEALSDVRRDVLFLFMAKCDVIVRQISRAIAPCTKGDIILYHKIRKGQRSCD
jgi:damage-control phosphatase, subfamily I